MLKKQISLLLATVMTLGTVNIAFANRDNNLPDVSYTQEEEEKVIPMLKSDTDIAYAVEGGNIYFDKNTGTITGADTDITSANIPNTIDSVAVTSIGQYAFGGCSSLTSITIPDSVASIGEHAFTTCLSLTSITIPKSVTSIGESLFYDCSSLTNIIVSKENTKYADLDGVLFNKDFSEIICYPIGKADKQYTIPDSVTSIGEHAFSSCSSLTNINIPDSVTDIGAWAFEDCISLTGISIPDGVTSIAGDTFYCCASLTNVTIPDSVTYIGAWAFYCCSSLISITIPGSVTSIENYAFQYCNSLTNVTISDGVTSIGKYTFDGCSSLTNLNIPDSVTFIGDNTFQYCSSLTSIAIPDSVTSIGYAAFWKCNSLTSIVVSKANTKYTNLDGILFNKDFSEIICYPIGKTDKQYTIPDSVTFISNNAFCDNSSLTSITIPESVTSIGYNAFWECSSLTSIAIPESVTSIKWGAFADCSKLKNVYYSGSKEQWNSIDIGFGNEYLSNADIHYNSVMPSTESQSVSDTETTTENTTLSTTSTETTTESTTTSAESTTEPTTEPDYVISGSSIVVPGEGGNVYIDKDSGEVADCDEGVISVNIPSKVNGIEVKSISAAAFAGCKGLKSITIPDTVTAIAENAFADCVSLTEIYCTKGSFADNKALYPENTEIKYEEKSAYLYGDADGDGNLVASDAAAVLQKVLKSTYKLPIEDLTPDYEKYLDVDGSGKLDAADAAMILQKVLKSTYKFSIEN